MCYGQVKRQRGARWRALGRQRGVELGEGHGLPEPVPRCLSLPPQSSGAYPLGFRQGTNAVRIERELWPERRLTGGPFGAAGSGVSPVGGEEAQVRHYLREQDERDPRQGELAFA